MYIPSGSERDYPCRIRDDSNLLCKELEMDILLTSLVRLIFALHAVSHPCSRVVRMVRKRISAAGKIAQHGAGLIRRR